MSRILSLSQAVEASLSPKLRGEVDAQFTIDIGDELWTVYTVSISDRDILCYCDQGTATFLVDTYGTRHFASLFDWEKDGVA